jgi:hypothetical protein
MRKTHTHTLKRTVQAKKRELWQNAWASDERWDGQANADREGGSWMSQGMHIQPSLADFGMARADGHRPRSRTRISQSHHPIRLYSINPPNRTSMRYMFIHAACNLPPLSLFRFCAVFRRAGSLSPYPRPLAHFPAVSIRRTTVEAAPQLINGAPRAREMPVFAGLLL